ncbi:unnamed protein product [Adineta ricciae]|uniref:Uncharacterized protein n=1 Tax=Adineta ricciae TaxID=249248 RepID=A0A813P8F4_ADIRI|nr:unnamed protein product [Adineta ricciae]
MISPSLSRQTESIRAKANFHAVDKTFFELSNSYPQDHKHSNNNKILASKFNTAQRRWKHIIVLVHILFENH